MSDHPIPRRIPFLCRGEFEIAKFHPVTSCKGTVDPSMHGWSLGPQRGIWGMQFTIAALDCNQAHSVSTIKHGVEKIQDTAAYLDTRFQIRCHHVLRTPYRNDSAELDHWILYYSIVARLYVRVYTTK